MGLLDKLIDKIFDSAKKNKMDSIIKKLAKDEPEFGKKVAKHQRSVEEIQADLYKILQKKGLRP